MLWEIQDGRQDVGWRGLEKGICKLVLAQHHAIQPSCCDHKESIYDINSMTVNILQELFRN